MKQKTKNRPTIELDHFQTVVCAKKDFEPFLSVFALEGTSLEEEKLGRLFGVIQVLDQSEQSSYLPNLLIQVIKKEFFQRPKDTLEKNFESAIRKANLALADLAQHEIINWIGNLGAVVGAVQEDEFIFTQAGTGRLLLLRDGQISDIAGGMDESENHPIKTFSNVSSGHLEIGDKIIFTTEGILDIFSWEDLNRHSRVFASDEFDNLIKSTLEAEGQNIGTLVLNARERVPVKRPVAKPKVDESTLNFFGSSLGGASVKEDLAGAPAGAKEEGKEKDREKEKEKVQSSPVPTASAAPSQETVAVGIGALAAASQIASRSGSAQAPALAVPLKPSAFELAKKASEKRNGEDISLDPEKPGLEKDERSPFESQPELFIKEEDKIELAPPPSLREKFSAALPDWQKLGKKLKFFLEDFKERYAQKEGTPAEKEDLPADEQPIGKQTDDKERPAAPVDQAPSPSLPIRSNASSAEPEVFSGGPIATPAGTIDLSPPKENQRQEENDKEADLLSPPAPSLVGKPWAAAQVISGGRKKSRELDKKFSSFWNKEEPTQESATDGKAEPEKPEENQPEEPTIPCWKEKLDRFTDAISAWWQKLFSKRKKMTEDPATSSFAQVPEEEPEMTIEMAIKKELASSASAPKRNWRKIILIVTGVLAALALIGGGIFLFRRPSASETAQDPSSSAGSPAPTVEIPAPNRALSFQKVAELGAQPLVLTADKSELFILAENDKFFRVNMDSSEKEEISLPDLARGAQDIVAMDQLRLIFFVKPSGVASYSPVVKRFTQERIALPEGFKPVGSGTYLTFLYVADEKSRQIYRYPRAEGGFGDPKKWLAGDLPFIPADLAIDENIRLVGEEGKVEKYFQGRPAGNLTLGSEAGSLDRIKTEDGSSAFYLFSRSAGKIIKVRKDGDTVEKEYSDQQLKNVVDFWPNEKNGQLFLVTESGHVIKLAM